MLNALPADKNESLLVAHNSDFGCRFILEHLENAKPIVRGRRVLQIKATCYNPIKRKKLKTTMNYNYTLIPRALRAFGECFKIDVPKEVMPYSNHSYDNVKMGKCSIQSALDILNDSRKQHFLDNIETWNCNMDNQMFDLNKYSSIYCKMDCKVLMEDFVFSGHGC